MYVYVYVEGMCVKWIGLDRKIGVCYCFLFLLLFTQGGNGSNHARVVASLFVFMFFFIFVTRDATNVRAVIHES